jgi:hypothetical protein
MYKRLQKLYTATKKKDGGASAQAKHIRFNPQPAKIVYGFKVCETTSANAKPI